MPGEVIHLNIGQAGTELSQAYWKLYCLEHNIGLDGEPDASDTEEPTQNSFFSISDENIYTPRSICVDSDPTAIDQMKLGELKQLFHPDNLVTDNTESCGSYPDAYNKRNEVLMQDTVNATRRETEACDNLNGFMFYHSLGGGMGSGFTSALVENLSDTYGKIQRLQYSLFPGEVPTETYNAVIALNALKDLNNCTFVLNTKKIFEICQENLNIENPTYVDSNDIIAQALSSISCSLRFGGRLNADMSDFQLSLIPFPSCHYVITSYSPIIPKALASTSNRTIQNITKDCFQPENHFIFDCRPRKDWYMSCLLLYRGEVDSVEVQQAVNSLKRRNMANFVEWSPVGITTSVNKQEQKTLATSKMIQVPKAVCNLTNSTCIKKSFAALSGNFDRLYKARAFLQIYENAGMDEKDVFVAASGVMDIQSYYEEIEDAEVSKKCELNEKMDP